MTWPPYPACRDSGSDWIGSIPETWRIAQLKRVATRITDGAHVSPETDGGVYDFVSTRDVGERGIDFEGSLKTTLASYDYLVRNGCQPSRGDVLFSKDGTIGRTTVVATDHPFVVASSLIIIKPNRREVIPEFLHYVCQSTSVVDQVDSFVRGAGLPRLSIANLTRITAAFPPLGEQRQIVRLLDRETNKIDALIDKQGQLIATLRENRAAVISSNADLGGRRVSSLGLLLDGLKDGTHGSFARVDTSEGCPLLGARNIMGGHLVLDGAESFVSETDHRGIVSNGFPRRGDVLLVIVGATIGKSAVYDREEPMSFQRSVAFLRPGHTLDSDFLWYQVQSVRFQDELWLRSKTSAQPGVYLGDVAAIPLYLPPLDEQRRVVAYLHERTAKIDALIEKATQVIETLSEYRSALITDAVTGKIDVRGAA